MSERIARLTLVALVAASAVSTDLYLSGIPQLARDLGVGPAEGQLTISLFMLGFAGGQLLFGPLSDYYGRIPVVRSGMWLYVAASLACTLAPTIDALLAARLLQGFAASAGPVIARAVVRDRYHGAEAARVMALLAGAMAVIPLVAPVLGSWLLIVLDWRAQFALLLLFGLLVVAGVGFMTESCPSVGQGRPGVGRVLRQFGTCLASPVYTGYLLCGAACFAGMFTWISSTSWIVIELLGVRPENFGYTFMFVVTGYMSGTLASTRVVPRLGVARTVSIGVFVALAGALCFAACAAGAAPGLGPVLGSVFLAFAGCGLCLPNAQAGAIGEFPAAAGGASAVFGFVQTASAATTGFLAGQLYDHSLRPTATLMLGAVCVAVVGTLMLARSRTRRT